MKYIVSRGIHRRLYLTGSGKWTPGIAGAFAFDTHQGASLFAEDTPGAWVMGIHPLPHEKDSDCTVDTNNNCCVVCGVGHYHQCPDCKQCGYHAKDCPELLEAFASVPRNHQPLRSEARITMEKNFCWTGITHDGALTGGYFETHEECWSLAANTRLSWFAVGPTPEDLSHDN